MSAEIIQFPCKSRFAEGEVSPLLDRPGLSFRSFTQMVPIECLRPFSEASDFDPPDIE